MNDNLLALDEAIEPEMILSHMENAGMQDAKITGVNEIRSRCVFHSGDNPTSFVVKRDPSKGNRWFFLCNSCGVKGDIFDLYQKMYNMSFGQVLSFLEQCTGVAVERPQVDPQNYKYVYESRKFINQVKGVNDELVVQNVFLESALAGFHPMLHKDLVDRGFDKAVRDYFELGFSTTWPLANRITIPIRDQEGNLVGIAGRTVIGEEPKYKFLKGSAKKFTLYNIHHIKPSKEPLLVVEGYSDVWRAWQYGIDRVVAIMGCKTPNEQARLIATLSLKVVVMLDGDAPGQGGSATMVNKLRRFCDVYEARIPDERDPAELSRDEFWHVYHSAKKV